MRTIALITLIFLLFSNFIFAQGFLYPTINNSGTNVKDFIPQGWRLKDSAKGDLNGDNIEDLALVIEYNDSVNETSKDSVILGSPRILLVMFKNKETGIYNKVEENKVFVLRHGEGGMDPEPYGGISIMKRVLQVDFQFVRSHASYKFRYLQGALYLVGFSSAGSSGGIFDSFDINMLTRKIKFEANAIDSGIRKIKWRKFNLKKLIRLSQMQHAFSWEIYPDVFI